MMSWVLFLFKTTLAYSKYSHNNRRDVADVCKVKNVMKREDWD